MEDLKICKDVTDPMDQRDGEFLAPGAGQEQAQRHIANRSATRACNVPRRFHFNDNVSQRVSHLRHNELASE